ncbi:hypothetical protein IDH32_04520 [Pelagibacterales bacterium SAG-MED01]|jgi:hypothetical protein|nr:hypothetical protein [Pelagibacterales bacterium SAG-MED01]|tara:strand:- start:282 stop:608 length:327 start_codon:yes stop_codon:yes gene_type:complete
MFNFNYTKPYYSEDEILELFSLTKSSLQRMREECLKSGGDLFLEMGYFHIKGIKTAMYEPVKFSAWLFEHRVEPESKYDYEINETNKVKEGLIKLSQYKPITKKWSTK